MIILIKIVKFQNNQIKVIKNKQYKNSSKNQQKIIYKFKIHILNWFNGINTVQKLQVL